MVERYLAIAHNERIGGQKGARMLLNLGGEDVLNADRLLRLMAFINRYLRDEPSGSRAGGRSPGDGAVAGAGRDVAA